MADNFGLRIGLEGEKEFKKAHADINSSLLVLLPINIAAGFSLWSYSFLFWILDYKTYP